VFGLEPTFEPADGSVESAINHQTSQSFRHGSRPTANRSPRRRS